MPTPLNRRAAPALRGFIITLPLLASGCASIVTGSNQVISVETRLAAATLPGASCQLTNDKGTYYVATPGTVTVKRSYGDLSVKCEKDNHEPGLMAVKSTAKSMMAGNILFGGIIGIAVDSSTGAGYDYPDLIQVLMGQNGTPALPAEPQAKSQ